MPHSGHGNIPTPRNPANASHKCAADVESHLFRFEMKPLGIRYLCCTGKVSPSPASLISGNSGDLLLDTPQRLRSGLRPIPLHHLHDVGIIGVLFGERQRRSLEGEHLSLSVETHGQHAQVFSLQARCVQDDLPGRTG